MMRRTAPARPLRAVLPWLLCLALVAAAGCKIVRDSDRETQAGTGGGAFDADSYVTEIWDSKLMPAVAERAVDITVLLDALGKDRQGAGKTYGHRAQSEGSAWNYLVKGEGRVVRLDTSSRRGTMLLEIGPAEAPRQVILQVGPVVAGSALRDALPFVSFNDFVNQLQFAQVSRKLNDRAAAAAQQALDPAPAEGSTVRFHGAMVDPGGGDVEITPILLQQVGATG